MKLQLTNLQKWKRPSSISWLRPKETGPIIDVGFERVKEAMKDKNDSINQKVLRAYAEWFQDVGLDYCAEDVARFIFGNTKLKETKDLRP